MSGDSLYDDWLRGRARAQVPEDFVDRVMHDVTTKRSTSGARLVLARAALLLLALGALALRAVSALAVFAAG